ncbi:MAG: hypothetical protein H7066_01060 [Cytophagaceae bacterium]|nr:hypothetical protein [Gemmatimonadaceae bacterium]
MKRARLFFLGIVVLTLVVASCRGDAEAASAALRQERDQRTARLASKLADSATSDSTPLARWILPNDLAEISGLVLAPDGRLFAHDDEQGRVTVIDPRTGFVGKAFKLKGKDVQEDFEGITLVDDTFYMVTSRGKIYTFTEGQDGKTVPFKTYDTRLGKECEFEGITHDPTTSQLVLPCKRPGDRNLRDQVVIYRVAVPLGEDRPQFQAVPIDAFRGTHAWKELQPTDIVRDSVTGHFIMVAAPQKALIELSPTFEVVRAVPLPAGHDQAEGVALTRDRVLIISDEAKEGPAAITLYRWPIVRRDTLP